MKKKIIPFFIAAMFTFNSVPTVFAAESTAITAEAYTGMSDKEKADYINANLSVRLQHLSRLAAISSNMAYDKMADEVKASLNDGLTVVEIKEAIYHSGAYCGITRAAKALDAADEALKALGQDVTYKSRITSTEENRYDDGLAAQRFLFGDDRPTIGAVTDDMEASLKLQTILLSGICFGDFYNRVGLPIYEREFITLCTIAGNGNCNAQFSSHTTGNLNVGHSKDMLRAAMLCNEDINGKAKTELAIEIISANKTELNENPKAERPQPTTAITKSFASDSEELLSVMEHFKNDDSDNYVGRNIDSETQKVLTAATEAVINKNTIPTSNDSATQVLIDLAVMDAQGGRESEVPAKVAEGFAAGLTKDNMLAVPLLTAPYNGFPRTLNMRSAIASAVDTMEEAINNPSIIINGSKLDTNVEINNGTAVAPVRTIFEALGYTVNWNGTNKSVIAENENTAKNEENNTLGFTFENDGKLEDAKPLFGLGDEFATENFTGTVYLNSVANEGGVSMANVTFEKGCINKWHVHDHVQILMGVMGEGYCQKEGEDAQLIQVGDVVVIPAGVKHWHGATHESQFTHMSVSGPVVEGMEAFGTKWLEPVSDEEYSKLK